MLPHPPAVRGVHGLAQRQRDMARDGPGAQARVLPQRQCLQHGLAVLAAQQLIQPAAVKAEAGALDIFAGMAGGNEGKMVGVAEQVDPGFASDGQFRDAFHLQAAPLLDRADHQGHFVELRREITNFDQRCRRGLPENDFGVKNENPGFQAGRFIVRIEQGSLAARCQAHHRELRCVFKVGTVEMAVDQPLNANLLHQCTQAANGCLIFSAA